MTPAPCLFTSGDRDVPSGAQREAYYLSTEAVVVTDVGRRKMLVKYDA